MFTYMLLAGLISPAAPPEVAAPDVRESVKKGLDWLAARQKNDGSWAGSNGAFTTSTTAYAGLAFLMEGTTPDAGEYCAALLKAVTWFQKNTQASGLLVPANDQTEVGRYMQGHTAALLFLASVYDIDDHDVRRELLRPILVAAVKYTIEAQTQAGGWGFVSAREGGLDHSASTALVLQALHTAEKAGIPVPRESLEKAATYLQDATAGDGGVNYSLANTSDVRSFATATTAAALLNADRKSVHLADWVAYSKRYAHPLEIDALGTPRGGFSSYILQQSLATARVAHALGETGHLALDPTVGEADLLRWSPFRERLFKYLKQTQTDDGYWSDGAFGASYTTALALIMLQMDNNYLPAFSR
jgi:squalene cyclase